MTNLGDGVYIKKTNYVDIVLMTENSNKRVNKIVLKPITLKAMLDWLEKERRANETSTISTCEYGDGAD